ncbi:MAG: NAD(P)H-hydrate dehydratase, partial [Verrucomicrobiae bacterium]|nr:NAD(P)H-hydrate dehydratase [Verrucomicrobiae bacterium]
RGETAASDDFAIVPETLAPLVRKLRRPFDFHKGQAGRVAIVAGSRGFTGAAKLCGLGALRGGAGLVTLFAAEDIYEIVAASAPPEIMVRSTADFSDVADFNADVIALGPGIGSPPAHEETLLELIQNDPRPMIVDADGLTLLGRRLNPVGSAFHPAGPRLLTPHPGEFARLWPDRPANAERRDLARGFVETADSQVTLLLKGARTVLARKGEPLAFNTTGHPGMATGGIGDVLTGLCAALVARGLTPFEAGSLGSWLIGRAAERSLDRGASVESLGARMVATRLGLAFDSLRGECY